MNKFYRVLEYINEHIYIASELTIEAIEEEKQNENYGAGRFRLGYKNKSKTVRSRTAKQTPTKVGQFVAFWEKDEKNNNRAYDYESAPDLLIVNLFKDGNFGQFIFPKEVLLKEKILRSKTSKGKMGIRVYPIWDRPTSKQARKTQNWQLDYFIDMTDTNKIDIKEAILKAYLFNNY